MGDNGLGAAIDVAAQAGVEVGGQQEAVSWVAQCHGSAGLLAITLRFARDADFVDAAAEVTQRLLNPHEPDRPFGYRGSARTDRWSAGLFAAEPDWHEMLLLS